MQLSSKSPATRVALLYITIGAVGIVWTLVWIVYLLNHPAHSVSTYYVCAGFLATGITVLLIGLTIGVIGRSARDAQTPNVVVPPAPPVQPSLGGGPVVVPQIPVAVPNGTIISPNAGVPMATAQSGPGGSITPDVTNSRTPTVVGGTQIKAQR